MAKHLETREATQAKDLATPIPTGRRVERQLDRDTSAARRQTGGHPTRMAGRHDGMHVTEHQRRRKP
jgi:hypothetical protein